MKMTSTFILLALGFQVRAETILRHPIVIESSKPIAIAELNDYLPETQQIPEYFQVALSETSKSTEQRWIYLQDQVDHVTKTLEGKFQALSITLGVIPTSVDTETHRTCYVGNALEVPDLVTKLVGFEFTKQLTLQSWKYNEQTQDVVLVGSYTDDGDEVNTMVISPCATKLQSHLIIH